jgi:diadenosine tetraphosphate (Ap4A) HIT family hydrolase
MLPLNPAAPETCVFELHPQLAADTVHVRDSSLCTVLLSRDANYPWLVLVPRRPDLRELHDLDPADQVQLLREVTALARGMSRLFAADKINVAALGNMVPQLHVHVIARQRDDPAWPQPVWGRVPALAYPPDLLAQRLAALRGLLADSESR